MSAVIRRRNDISASAKPKSMYKDIFPRPPGPAYPNARQDPGMLKGAKHAIVLTGKFHNQHKTTRNMCARGRATQPQFPEDQTAA